MKSWIAYFIIGIGFVHCLVGALLIGHIFQDLWSEGLFNTVNGQLEREAFFWFMAFGLLLMLLGVVLYWLAQAKFRLPATFAWLLLSFLLVLVIIMPVSGAWLLLVPIGGLFYEDFTSQRVSTK